MSTVGLSMIVLNEHVDRLAALVEYLKPTVSDFVIADTGSGDIDLDEPLYNTWGVKVMRVEWRKDFAWARNEVSLSRPTGIVVCSGETLDVGTGRYTNSSLSTGRTSLRPGG